VYRFIVENEGEVFLQEIIEEFDKSDRTIKANVKRLMRWGEVTKKKEGRQRKVIINEE